MSFEEPSMKERNKRINRGIDKTAEIRRNIEKADKRRLKDDEKYDLFTYIIIKELEKRHLFEQENLKESLGTLISELLDRPSFTNRFKKEETSSIVNATMRKINARDNQIEER